MIFNGELSKYHPADAMMFLTQAGVDGVLSVADQDCIIALTFKDGWLTDAQSARGDLKLMRLLRHTGRLNDSQIREIQRIQHETGLSVRQILGKLCYFPLAEIQDVLKTAILEVLHQLFLLDQGSFNFTETQVEDDGARIQLDTAKATLSITPRADEYRDFFKSILTGDRLVQLKGENRVKKQITPAEQLVLKMAGRHFSVKDLLDKAPLPTYEVLWHLRQFLTQGMIELGAPMKEAGGEASPVMDPMFAAFKQALKTLLGCKDVLPRLEALISFGKTFYDRMLILTSKQGDWVHAKIISMDPATGMVQKTVKGNLGRVEGDPVFATVSRSGIAFFGKTFPCALIDQIIGSGAKGECALIPILRSPGLSIFFYAWTKKTFPGLSPHHYLELLSWIMAPTPGLESPARSRPERDDIRLESREEPAPSVAPAEEVEKRIAKMVGRIRELPPLPTWVSQILQLLSNPETPLEEIETLVSKDQALVAKLIQVGNSALYGGMQKVTTLRQVLTRLGLKTIRNLILTVSTRSYFINNRKGMRVWGQTLWQHAVESGLAARRIAEEVNYPDPEEAFIGGLVHDIGKLVILMLFADSHKEILKLKKVNQIGIISAETQVIGADHEQIGKMLLDRWNMPAGTRACAEYHHRYDLSGDHQDLVSIVAFADHLSRQYGASQDTLLAEDVAYMQALTASLNIDSAHMATLVETIIDDFQNAELMAE